MSFVKRSLALRFFALGLVSDILAGSPFIASHNHLFDRATLTSYQLR